MIMLPCDLALVAVARMVGRQAAPASLIEPK